MYSCEDTTLTLTSCKGCAHVLRVDRCGAEEAGEGQLRRRGHLVAHHRGMCVCVWLLYDVSMLLFVSGCTCLCVWMCVCVCVVCTMALLLIWQWRCGGTGVGPGRVECGEPRFQSGGINRVVCCDMKEK
jgi:hypothetical protein